MVLNFKSPQAYKKWLAYKYIHVSPKPSENPQKVTIAGKPHKVEHGDRVKAIKKRIK